MSAPTCKVCDSGTLTRRKIHRMSPVVVFIGWVLLIPSLLGVIGSALGIAASVTGGAAGTAAAVSLDETRLERMEEMFGSRFDDAELPRSYIAKITQEGAPPISAEEAEGHTDAQRALLAEVGAATIGDRAGAVVGGGAAVGVAGLGIVAFGLLGVGSVVSGLLGWLLVMKKKVLQCVSCEAVVAAS